MTSEGTPRYNWAPVVFVGAKKFHGNTGPITPMLPLTRAKGAPIIPIASGREFSMEFFSVGSFLALDLHARIRGKANKGHDEKRVFWEGFGCEGS